MTSFALSKSELKLMSSLWEEKYPLTALEMLDKFRDRGWGEHYLRVTLKSLEKKGMVEVIGFQPRKNQYARKFRSAMTKEEYYIKLAQHDGASPWGLMEHSIFDFFRKKEDPEEERRRREELAEKLEKIVEEYLAQGDEEENNGKEK